MRVLFVIEAGFKVGLGHLLRCRALMLELAARGAILETWICGDLAALNERAWPAEMKTQGARNPDDPRAVIAEIVDHLRREPFDWAVIDGYNFAGSELYDVLHEASTRVLMLDDIPGRRLKTDILLNQNTEDRQIYPSEMVQSSCFLLGPKYALIEEDYRAGELARYDGTSMCRVLISFGGVDRADRTRRVLSLLAAHQIPMELNVVLGPYYPFEDEIRPLVDSHRIRLHKNVKTLAPLMRDSNIMISAAGSTVWQAACVGIPVIAVQTVDNQHELVRTLTRTGAAPCMDARTRTGDDAGIDAQLFMRNFSHLTDPSNAADLSRRLRELVDGAGPRRVADTLASW